MVLKIVVVFAEVMQYVTRQLRSNSIKGLSYHGSLDDQIVCYCEYQKITSFIQFTISREVNIYIMNGMDYTFSNPSLTFHKLCHKGC